MGINISSYPQICFAKLTRAISTFRKNSTQKLTIFLVIWSERMRYSHMHCLTTGFSLGATLYSSRHIFGVNRIIKIVYHQQTNLQVESFNQSWWQDYSILNQSTKGIEIRTYNKLRTPRIPRRIYRQEHHFYV